MLEASLLDICIIITHSAQIQSNFNSLNNVTFTLNDFHSWWQLIYKISKRWITFLSLIFLVTRMIFTLLELEAVCDDSCWSPPPCSLTSSIWPSGCRTVGCPSMTLIPESLVASSSSSCSYSYIIINNTYYSWTTWEFRLDTYKWLFST